MIDNIDGYFWVSLGMTLFAGMWSAGAIFGLFVNTKKIENDRIRKFLRVAVVALLVCVWLWFFCYKVLYPISLAKYEYTHEIYQAETGVVNSIKRVGNSEIKITIDNVVYTLIDYGIDYGEGKNAVLVEKEFKKGDHVSFQYGKSSKYIFLISRQTQDSNNSIGED
ncbi:MAG: hypothetical protein K6G89_06760 [Clostridia bacterium]|nr:hypothetical protein [Clostridia bacterium]